MRIGEHHWRIRQPLRSWSPFSRSVFARDRSRDASRMRRYMSTTFHKVTRQTLPMRYSTQTQNSIHPNIRTCSRPWHVLEDLLMFHVSVFFRERGGNEFFTESSRSARTTFETLWSNIVWEEWMPGVLKQSVIILFSDEFLLLDARPWGRCMCFGHQLLRRCACRVPRLCYWHDVRPNLWEKKKCATVVFRTFFFSVSRMWQIHVKILS